jgi:hypothetical protein
MRNLTHLCLGRAADVTLGFGTTLDKAAKTLAANPQKFVLSLFVPVYRY